MCGHSFPIGHTSQLETPSTEYDPGQQRILEFDVWLGHAYPAGHDEHDVAPPVEYVPGGHVCGKPVLVGHIFPAGQVVQ